MDGIKSQSSSANTATLVFFLYPMEKIAHFVFSCLLKYETQTFISIGNLSVSIWWLMEKMFITQKLIMKHIRRLCCGYRPCAHILLTFHIVFLIYTYIRVLLSYPLRRLYSTQTESVSDSARAEENCTVSSDSKFCQHHRSRMINKHIIQGDIILSYRQCVTWELWTFWLIAFLLHIVIHISVVYPVSQ